MKKIIAILLVAFVFNAKAQITLDQKYLGIASTQINLDKFHVSGYKYTQINTTSNMITIYNLNHSVFKSFPIPNVPGTNKSIHYITENLFDSDNLMEFVLSTWVAAPVTSTTLPGPSTGVYNFYIFKEDGTQLFSKDSATFFYSTANSNATNITDPIFNDGISTKMKVSIQQGSQQAGFSRTEIYNLPGTLPCEQCTSNSSGPTALSKNSSSKSGSATFYPNPVSDQLKLKYTLPVDAKVAIIRITDLQGKLLEELKVTDSFDYILVPSNYNNGMYLYSLIVDGNAVKTEKIILDK